MGVAGVADKRATCDFTEDLLHSKGPGGPSDYIGYTSVTGRNDPALAPFEGLTGALVVFTRLGSLGMGCNHTQALSGSRDKRQDESCDCRANKPTIQQDLWHIH